MRISDWSSDVCSSDLRQNALDLAAEVGVTRRIDDIDPRRVRALMALRRPFDRGAFGENGDPALLFDVARIHRAFLDTLILAERPRLAEKLVDESGLAMIDVRDDGDIAQGHQKYLMGDRKSTRLNSSH